MKHKLLALTAVALLASSCGGQLGNSYDVGNCKKARLLHSIFVNESDPTTNAFLGTKPPNKELLQRVTYFEILYCTK